MMTPFTETLAQAISAAEADLVKRQAVPVDAEWASPYQFDGIPYGTSKSVNIELASHRGHKTRKYAHLTIWRLDSGRYEWNVYVL